MNIRFVAIQILFETFTEQKHLPTLLNSKLGYSGKDRALISEICYGVARYYKSLEKIAKQLAPNLKLTFFAKSALFVGLYQIVFLQRVPHYAAIFETIEAIKSKLSQSKCAFIHALLQQAKQLSFSIDKEENFPQFFLDQVAKSYPQKKSELLAALMQSPKWFGREKNSLEYRQLNDNQLGEWIANDGYIQNPMSIELIKSLSSSFQPRLILDLCCGKGGKTFLAHLLFPDAEFTAIDKSEDQLKSFQANKKKYSFSCRLVQQDILSLESKELFDLVIIDVPCSNSGVYAKHPEAKWHLSKKSLAHLNKLQSKMLRKAFSLVKPGGEAWYLTCSILPQENQEIVRQFRSKKEKFIFPTIDGIHGGYGCSFRKAK